VEGVAKKARIIEKEAKDEQERILAKKGKLPAQPEPDAKVPKKKR
jgi:hypothetical protein